MTRSLTAGARRQWCTLALAGVAGIAGIATVGSAKAETYPSRPITLVHGFGAGGNIDVVSRIIGPALAEKLGQPVVVEARTGAGGTVADLHVAKSRPDGYTLLMMHGGNAIAAAIYKKLPYVPLEDFTPLAVIGRFPFSFSVRADSPFKTLADVIEGARAAPDRITFSSVGVGSTPHLTGELLQATAGVRMTHVPYRGGGAPLTDVLGGQVDILADSLTVALPQVRAGKLRLLAVTSPAAWPLVADVPPVSATVPGYDVLSWHGVGAPKGLPEPIAERLTGALQEVLRDPAIRERLAQNAGLVVGEPQTRQQMHADIAAQIRKWKQVVADRNIPQQ